MELTHYKRDIFIVADDLGLHPAVNEGIFFAFKNGLIDAASLMANGDEFEDAVRNLAYFPIANIGAHFVLVEENPLTGIKFPKNHNTFFVKYVLGLIKKSDIEKELEAQIKKILKTGIALKFLNSHQHLHLLPSIVDIVISLAKKYGIPYIRIVREPFKLKGGLLRKAQLIVLNILSCMAKNKIKRSGLGCNDFFIGFTNAGNLSLDDISLAKMLKNKNPNKIIELGCHPGFENSELIGKYKHWGGYHWRQEIEVLGK